MGLADGRQARPPRRFLRPIATPKRPTTATCNGKDETIDTAIARNESGTGLVGRLWKKNSEGGYGEDGKAYCSSCTEVKPVTPGFAHISGHAETERWFKEFTYTLSGDEYIE